MYFILAQSSSLSISRTFLLLFSQYIFDTVPDEDLYSFVIVQVIVSPFSLTR